MKIIIKHSKTKRQINGAFEVCGSRADLVSLAEQILAEANGGNFTYGWITVHSDRTPALPNTPPKEWDE
jgi:hypothetical protein